MPVKISAVVLTYNEEDNIERCLLSLDFCDEIVIIDSGSNDKTLELARKYTGKIYFRRMEGYGAERNFAIEKCSNDWIFSLDADEEVSGELKKAVLALKPGEVYAGYYVNRMTYYLGRWIKHSGWYPQYVLRLFDKRRGGCRDAAIHEGYEISGKAGRLQGDIYHYSYRTLSHHLQKIDKYTSRIAEERFANGKRFNLLKAVFAPGGEFLKKYVLKAGFLDGFAGFCVAMTSGYYTFLKQAKLYEYHKIHKKKHPPSEV